MKIIDSHCHLLPGIDDGAIDQEMMISMARVAADAYTCDIVVTPHHGNGVFDNIRSQVLDLVAKNQALLDQQQIPITLHPGSELHLTPELIDEIKAGEILTYADKGKSILVELPKQSIPVGADKILLSLLDMGIHPVIAHPERNGELLRNPSIYEQWVDWGCYGQLTGMSVDGRFGKLLQSVCDRWIRKGVAHIIASDAHRPRGRSPDLSECYVYVVNHYGNLTAKRLFYDNPICLLNGEQIGNMARLNPLIKPSQPIKPGIIGRIQSLFRQW